MPLARHDLLLPLLMNAQQKAVCRELLALSYESGFHHYPLAPIAEKLGIKGALYDNNTNKGLLWKLGRHGSGILDVSTDGKTAAIPFDQRGPIANWCGYRGRSLQPGAGFTFR